MSNPYETQDNNPDAWVCTRIGHDYDTGKDITEILIQEKIGGDHHHYGIDAVSGDPVFGEIQINHGS